MFWPEEFHALYSPWGHKESDPTEQLSLPLSFYKEIMVQAPVCAGVASVLSNSFDSTVVPWTVAHQAPLFIGILQARILEWFVMPSSRGSSQPRDQSCISYSSCVDKWVLITVGHGLFSSPHLPSWLLFHVSCVEKVKEDSHVHVHQGKFS